MLIMFRVKNFTSFREDVVLDMRATGFKQHPSHVVAHGDFRLLKTAAIYGANASGKSNLISALFRFRQYILKQLFQDKWEEASIEESDALRGTITMEPFLLTGQVERCIEMEMIFSNNDVLYQYGFSFEDTNVLSEWLLIDDELVFDRKKRVFEYGKKYKTLLKDYRKFRDDRLYLSVLDYFATGSMKDSIDNFKSFFQTKLNIHFELFLESSVKGTMGMLGLSKRLVEDAMFRMKVAEYIRRIDVGIVDLTVVEESKHSKTGEISEISVVKPVHEKYDTNGNKNGTEVFEWRQESTGTLRFLSFIQSILILLEKGGVFIIDKLSSRLHPLLTKFIVDIFQSNVNVNNAQLIFTTHDTSILNKEQFRRDEILFVEKNKRGESSLYSLADLKPESKTVRQDATYNKDYFNGKYGAIPIILDVNDMSGGE